ncbi:Protein of unknown function DUF3468 [Penicillium capsulatum]|nr:Protein of unknown function DUF3468 [Penicillium capsulatum]
MSSASPAQSPFPGQLRVNEDHSRDAAHGNDQRQSGNELQLLGLLPSTPQDTPILNAEDWALDLELMHHFLTSTCNTLTLREDSRHVWRVVMPTEGYGNRYLMHGLLAIGALHRAYLYSDPAQKEKYIKASAYHLATGLKEFRELITAPIDPNNWQPVFCFSSMISIHLTGSSIRLGIPQWPSPIENMVELFTSVAGFQAIMKPFLHHLSKTQLAPLANSVWIESDYIVPSPSLAAQSLLPPDIWTQISHLHRLIDDYPFPEPEEPTNPSPLSDSDPHEQPPDHRGHYKIALKFYEHATRQLELAGPHVESGMVFLWVYPLSKQFHEDVLAYHPAALALLAHYCVLLRAIDHFWYVNGIGRQLLTDIESKMHPGFREWLNLSA